MTKYRLHGSTMAHKFGGSGSKMRGDIDSAMRIAALARCAQKRTHGRSARLDVRGRKTALGGLCRRTNALRRHC